MDDVWRKNYLFPAVGDVIRFNRYPPRPLKHSEGGLIVAWDWGRGVIATLSSTLMPKLTIND